MATVTAFTVQVALHNAGGYNEAITIVPNPPDAPDGLEAEMNLDNGITNVPVRLPLRTNGASVSRVHFTYETYFDESMLNGFEVHQVKRKGYPVGVTKVTVSCPTNSSTAPVTCVCMPANRCMSASFVGSACVAEIDETVAGDDTLVVVVCSHALANLTSSISSSVPIATAASSITSVQCPDSTTQSVVSCSILASNGEDHAVALAAVTRNGSSCDLTTRSAPSTSPIKIQARCVQIPTFFGSSIIEVAPLAVHVSAKDGSAWHQAALNLTYNHDNTPIVPIAVSAHAENFFGISQPRVQHIRATLPPSSFKIRVDKNIRGLQYIIDNDQVTTGLPEDRYLIQHWPTYKGRAQIVVPPPDFPRRDPL